MQSDAENDKRRFEGKLEQAIVPAPPGFEPYFVHLACCQVWTGTMSPNGFGRIFVNRTAVPIQEYAGTIYRILRPLSYSELVLGVPERRKVLRCTAAGTKNCVHRDHLGWVQAGADPCKPIELKVRDAIRYHFTLPPDHKDWMSMQRIAIDFRYSEARVCRILLYLDGADDQRKFEELRVPARAE